MPVDDIMPFVSEHGGHDKINYFQMGDVTTSTVEDTSWERGYWLQYIVGDPGVDALVDGTDDPASITNQIVVSAASSAGLIQTRGGTSGAATHAIRVPCYDVYSGMEFRTRNVFASGSDTNVGPLAGAGDGTMTNVVVGATADVWVDDTTATMVGHVHGLDLAGNFFEITRILDTSGEDTFISSGTADWVVFRAVPRIS